MLMRRSGRWIAGTGLVVALLLTSSPNRAVAVKSDPKWETERTSEPGDREELMALQDRVRKVVDKCSPSTVGILIGFGAGSGVIVSEDGLVLTAAHVITGEDLFGK